MSMESLAGIPGTIDAETRKIRWFAIPCPTPDAKAYRADVPDGTLAAMVSRDAAGKNGRKLWHVSVSHHDRDNKPGRCPTFDELKHAAYRLIQADVCMVLIFPRRAASYVDVHPTCLHLWESEQEIDL